MYIPLVDLIEAAQMRHYHKKLLAGGFSFDAFGSMWHTEQALTRDELAGGLANAIGLVLDAHESHLEVADELRLALCE
jgi:2-hydroxychromene-2-carboxylate isomerase